MEEKEVVITHQTLFEMLKIEKDRSELQKIDDNFFNDVIDYIKEKRKITSGESLFSNDEKKKVEKQIDNVRRILKDLYDKREKKIIYLALDKSRTKSDLFDKSAFLKEEKQIFNELTTLFDKFRTGILYNLLNESMPSIEEKKLENNNEKKEIVENKLPEKEKSIEIKENKLVRFKHAVPKFVGKELEEYGPFDENDIANLPNEIVDVLILKERVEEINEK